MAQYGRCSLKLSRLLSTRIRLQNNKTFFTFPNVI
nr:MAG TPA: hypothetical protein [Caudoviricetes sp.]